MCDVPGLLQFRLADPDAAKRAGTGCRPRWLAGVVDTLMRFEDLFDAVMGSRGGVPILKGPFLFMSLPKRLRSFGCC